jgi:DNA mismatch repair ATPase MutS
MKGIFKQIKSNHPDYLIIIKKNNLGQIYENDAIIAKDILGIELNKNGILCFSWELLDSILVKLIHNGIKVAVRE